jgi:hypothetical protein
MADVAFHSAGGTWARDAVEDTARQAADLGLIPPDAFAFVSVRVADLWESDLGRLLRKEFPGDEADLTKHFRGTVGTSPANAERVTLLFTELPFGLFRDWVSPPVEARSLDRILPQPGQPFTPPEGRFAPPPGPGAAPSKAVDDALESRETPWVVIVQTARALDADEVKHSLRAWEPRGRGGLEWGGDYKGKMLYPIPARPDLPQVLCLFGDRTFIFGDMHAVQRIVDAGKTPKGQGPLADALHLAQAEHAVTAGLSLTPKQGRILREVVARLPRSDGRMRFLARFLAPFLPAQSATLTLDLGRDTRAAVQLRFAEDAQAQTAGLAVQDAVTLLRIFAVSDWVEAAQQQVQEGRTDVDEQRGRFALALAKRLEEALRSARMEPRDGQVQLALRVRTDADALAAENRAALKAARQAPDFEQTRNRKRSAQNLREIVLGMHRYHDTLYALPPAAIIDNQDQRLPNAPADKPGKSLPSRGYFSRQPRPSNAPADKPGEPLLSWRVALLPFLGQEKLYREFKLDEPWDSEHNQKLLARMPAVYAAPGVRTRKPYLTYYQAFVGRGAAFEGPRGMRIAEFQDGTSCTLLLAEAASPVPWTKPEDLAYDPAKPLPRLGGLYGEGFNAGFCDGEVRFIRRGIDEQMLRALITRAGGEIVDLDRIR